MAMHDGDGAASGSAPVRGRLMLTKTVRREFFSDEVSDWWVRRNVAPSKRIKLGHSTVAWYERDVQEWLDGRRAS